MFCHTDLQGIRKSLTKGKERPGMSDVKGVVCSIPCADCPATYIGSWTVATDREDAEGLYGRTQEGGKEQGSSEWNLEDCI